MARKRTGRVTRRKGSPGQRKKKTRSKKIVRSTLTRVNVITTRLGNLTTRSLFARSRSLQVLSDLRRDPSLTFSQAAENRNVGRGTARKYISSALRRDDSGRVKARPNDPIRETMFIPSTKPDERIPIQTKNNKERQIVGQWHTALNAAASGDFSLIRKFPRGQIVGGVLLPTGPHQIQKILAAQAEAETKLEGPYRTLARPA